MNKDDKSKNSGRIQGAEEKKCFVEQVPVEELSSITTLYYQITHFCKLTRSSAKADGSNTVMSDCNWLAFSFPRVDANTRNCASRAASLARDTVMKMKKNILLLSNAI